MIPQWLIEKKRDGGALSAEEIRAFIQGYTEGAIPDYQMAALAMAITWRGMTAAETAALTEAMLRSGDVVDTSSLARPKVDKHSTGGIGDKVSLLLAPLAAACGVAVPMISGRGLGITGGTLDKLESIPGFRVQLEEAEFLAVLREVGCAMIGQTARLAPADRKLYALRDVTATVPSIPLITASILCKKLAEGIDTLVLDVKWGRGAFMKTLEDARRLARSLVDTGQALGARVSALLTAMDQPLGRTVGNRLEVIEAAEGLRGHGPADLMELTFALTGLLLVDAGVATDAADAQRRMEAAIASGAAWERFLRLVAAQGGDVRAAEDPIRLPAARLQVPLPSPAAGWVAAVDAEKIGRAVLLLGGGRTRTDDRIDPAVGLAGLVKIGERVISGQPLAVLHANDETRLRATEEELQGAFRLTEEPTTPPALITERLLAPPRGSGGGRRGRDAAG
jgi:pyrimidine-nucleoside phosphorylase